MERQFVVHIITNKKDGVLYVGVTSNLPKRIWEHKNKVIEGFTKKYNLYKLVYFETHDSAEGAILYEKKLKNRSRAFKIQLVEKRNPEWSDLYESICN